MKPDRIDFTIIAGGVQVMKFRRDVSNPQRPRDIPIIDGASMKPVEFDLEAAISWCKAAGYTVREIPGRSARAWLGDKPWPIRSRSRIKRMRQSAERANRDYFIDFAYDG